jgi:hypothetical protein
MKKVYIAPQLKETLEMDITLLTNSQSINGGDNVDAGYGGVDTEGTKDPSSRFYQGWTESDEEEF